MAPGHDPLRLEGLDKLIGAERYVDDLPQGDSWWGMTVRSPAPRGEIVDIRFGSDTDWSEFVIVGPDDLPGPNVVAMYLDDQPVLAPGRVRHVHEPVLLLAHPDRARLRRAVRAVEVVVDERQPVLDFVASPRREDIQHDDDNVFAQVRVDKGDVEAALADAHRVIEGEYRTGAQEHVYLENQGMIAWEEDGVLTVTGSMQCPHYVLAALCKALVRDEDRVRVIWAPTGGAFGGKEEYPSVLALHAALLALAAGRPVRMVYDRDEDMAVTTKRHPSWIRHRTGVDADGRLVAQDITVILDGGAYVTLSPVVLSRGVIHAAGPYRCPNVRIDGRAVLTNTPPRGAFRGFGAPQTLFACERHMDVVARTIGIDPVELRRRNLLRDGDATATGQVIDDGTDRVALLERALAEARWDERKGEHARLRRQEPWLRRGIGLASFFHGAGFTGSGETHLASRVRLAGLPDGTVEVRSGQTEMGQGTTTVFTSIAADRLGVPREAVRIAVPDTSRVPNSGPTVASRTVMVVGHIIEQAADRLRASLGLDPGADGAELQEAIRGWYADRHPERSPAEPEELVVEAQYEPPPGIHWDDANYRGHAYATFAWSTQVAEVEVDLRTYTARVIDFVAVQEIGRVIHPVLATGQIQGGVVQGIGWALSEDHPIDERGAMRNPQLTNYIIPTSADVPPIRVVFLENPYEHGGGGAKGIGELPIDGPAPAIANAIADALSVEPDAIPLTPERLMELLEEQALATGEGSR